MNIQETETDSTLSQLLAPGATGLACNWIIFLLDWPHNKRRAQLQKKLQKTQKIRKRQCTWQSCFTCCCIGFMVYVFLVFFKFFFVATASAGTVWHFSLLLLIARCCLSTEATEMKMKSSSDSVFSEFVLDFWNCRSSHNRNTPSAGFYIYIPISICIV